MIRQTLFDNIERNFLGPAGYAESRYVYLNRSARKWCERVRLLLEEWYRQYSAGDKQDLRARFRSDKSHNQVGAFFELYCYALLRSHGYTMQLHPSVTGKELTHPDFEVYSAGERLFYFESTVAFGRKHESNSYLDQLHDNLNQRLHSPNFFVHLEVRGEIPNTMPSTNVICNKLSDWLDSLNVDDVFDDVEAKGVTALPSVDYEIKGWKLRFVAQPKSQSMRTTPGLRPIGGRMHIPPSLSVDSQRPLLPSLQSKKPRRYGDIDLPYVIAVNVLDFLDDFQTMNVLFGTEGLNIDSQTFDTTFTRLSNGFWFGPKGIQNTRVSAILLVSLLEPYTLAQQQPILWHNPWASRPLAPSSWQGPQVIADMDEQVMRRCDGRAIHEMLNLEPAWPHFRSDD